MKDWVVFGHKGKKLLKLSVEGGSMTEVEETQALLAHEHGIPAGEINVWIEED